MADDTVTLSTASILSIDRRLGEMEALTRERDALLADKVVIYQLLYRLAGMMLFDEDREAFVLAECDDNEQELYHSIQACLSADHPGAALLAERDKLREVVEAAGNLAGRMKRLRRLPDATGIALIHLRTKLAALDKNGGGDG